MTRKTREWLGGSGGDHGFSDPQVRPHKVNAANRVPPGEKGVVQHGPPYVEGAEEGCPDFGPRESPYKDPIRRPRHPRNMAKSGGFSATVSPQKRTKAGRGKNIAAAVEVLAQEVKEATEMVVVEAATVMAAGHIIAVVEAVGRVVVLVAMVGVKAPTIAVEEAA